MKFQVKPTFAVKYNDDHLVREREESEAREHLINRRALNEFIENLSYGP